MNWGGFKIARAGCLLFWLTLVLIICILSSCGSIQNGLYSTFIDTNTKGEDFLRYEPEVKIFLEKIVDSCEQYSIKAFSRKAGKHQPVKTRLMTHSYYLLICINREYHTLSFYGTDMAFYSKGAWVLDAESDVASYSIYLTGKNKWSVEELFLDETIETARTVQNIIGKMDSGVTYYYKDHVKNKPGVDNCNTALYETVVFEKTAISGSPD